MTNLEIAVTELDVLLNAQCKIYDCNSCNSRTICDLLLEYRGDTVPHGISWWLKESKD